MRVECKSEITKISCTEFVPQKNQVGGVDLVFLLADCWLFISVQPLPICPKLAWLGRTDSERNVSDWRSETKSNVDYVTGCYTSCNRDGECHQDILYLYHLLPARIL